MNSVDFRIGVAYIYIHIICVLFHNVYPNVKLVGVMLVKIVKLFKPTIKCDMLYYK